jgi:hypothetical protein
MAKRRDIEGERGSRERSNGEGGIEREMQWER